jgi:hypothetical protein
MRHDPQNPVRHPKQSTPLDLGEDLCAELAHLFCVEADPLMQPDEWIDGVDFDNYMATSNELAYFANVLRSRRINEIRRNLAPWQTMPAAAQIRNMRRLP